MKYTESEDRLFRATLNIKIRVTQDQMAELRRQAKEHGESLHDYLAAMLGRTLEETLTEGGGEMEQRYGRGGD